MSLCTTTDPCFGVVASVAVYPDPRHALPHWRDLAAFGTASPYQSPDWVLSWLDTVGAATRVTPLVMAGFDREGRALVLLPLGVQHLGGLTVGSFLGGKDSNFNMGLFRPGTDWTRQHILALLRRGVAESGTKVDVFALRNQPESWQGAGNPLSTLSRQPSPSFARKAEVDGDTVGYLGSRLSRDNRKKLRQKMNRLRAIGPVSVVDASDTGGSAEILDAFVSQRTARNTAAGLPCDDLPALRRFLDRTVGVGGPVAFYGLRCGERIVATLGGVRGRDRFSGMLMSFLAEGDVARASPGELLLVEVMKRQGDAGLQTFDLGVGEARYKETYCPDVEPLFDSLVPLSSRGHVFARFEAVRLRVKRAIKQSGWAWPLLQRLRRAASGLSG